jgi:anhydro-N-acetylmuramic acid kinase
MSGTSLDGIDLALLKTNGKEVTEIGGSRTERYETSLREKLRALLGFEDPDAQVVKELTIAHAEAVRRFLENQKLISKSISVIGFHGHTILHQPHIRKTLQIGDGQLLANLTGINVVNNFRAVDVANGGQGAPITPIFHQAMGLRVGKPFALLNIGGVANVTWVGSRTQALLAFDTGPGGGQLDEWTQRAIGEPFDDKGLLARAGDIDIHVLSRLLKNPYFERSPPKSLDRNDFSIEPVLALNAADGAATLLEFSCAAIAMAERHFPSPVERWLVTGGGRKNEYMLERIEELVKKPVMLVDELGWDGDAVEAQAFAYLAVRTMNGLPITFPNITGVDRPRVGGEIYKPAT